MKRIFLLTMSLAAVMVAGAAYAQDATTRGGARSAVPSTRQNSPYTGAFTGPSANTNTRGYATSGRSMAPPYAMQPPLRSNKVRRAHRIR